MFYNYYKDNYRGGKFMNYHNFQRYKNGDIDIKKFYVVMLC